MAPKQQKTQPMKRPAGLARKRVTAGTAARVSSASGGRAQVAKASKATPAGESTISERSPAVGTIRGPAKANSITNALLRVEVLPAAMRKRTGPLVRRVCAGICGPDQQLAFACLQSTLAVEEERLSASAREAQHRVEGADDDKQAREAAVMASESKIADLKCELAAAKAALVESEKAIATAHDNIENVKVAKRSCDGDLRVLKSKRARLEAAEKEVYEPLKSQPAAGSQGQKNVKTLCRTGKEFGFHAVLLSTLPAVLKKELVKRQTFDDLAIQQLEAEFTKHTGAVSTAITDAEAALAERATETQVAQDALAAAKLQQKTSARAIADLEKAIATCTEELAAARLRMKAFQKDARNAVNDLNRSRGKLLSFRTGPLCALNELHAILQSASSSVEVEAQATAEAAVLEPVLDRPPQSAAGQSSGHADGMTAPSHAVLVKAEVAQCFQVDAPIVVDVVAPVPEAEQDVHIRGAGEEEEQHHEEEEEEEEEAEMEQEKDVDNERAPRVGDPDDEPVEDNEEAMCQEDLAPTVRTASTISLSKQAISFP